MLGVAFRGIFPFFLLIFNRANTMASLVPLRRIHILREFGLFATAFRRVDGQEIIAPNVLLASTKTVHNPPHIQGTRRLDDGYDLGDNLSLPTLLTDMIFYMNGSTQWRRQLSVPINNRKDASKDYTQQREDVWRHDCHKSASKQAVRGYVSTAQFDTKMCVTRTRRQNSNGTTYWVGRSNAKSHIERVYDLENGRTQEADGDDEELTL
ncbi:hypothetical protein BDZ89DRAFT_1048135 [Hymenopellis radicata]|nr:hypothetical protein BDZ89DRAFT_1048135 [Hymenopellis radicata]